MNEEELSRLSLEDKLKVIRFLIADLASHLLSEEAKVKDKARHDLGSLAMTFSNLYQLIQSSADNKHTVVQSIYSRYRYRDPVEQETGHDSNPSQSYVER